MLARWAFRVAASLRVRRLLPVAAVVCLLVTPTPAQPPAGQQPGRPPAGKPPAAQPDRPPAGQPPEGQPPEGQPGAGKPADQAAIDQAIDAGVTFLKRSQNPAGHWGTGTGPGSGKGWGVGHTALAGIALIECGVPPSDPGIRRAAAVVRANINEIEFTYEAALVILFLDRMRDKSDRQRIQMLAGRLMAGQSPSGGWGYKIPKHNVADSINFLNALRRMSPAQPPTGPSIRERPPTLGLCIKASDDTQVRQPPAFDPAKARAAAVAMLPPGMKRLPILFDKLGEQLPDDPKDKRNDLVDATTDNSNTHFAMLGLWAARKHDIPTDRAFELLTKRFRTSQGKSGSWSYDFASKGADGSGAMTCVALLGIAIGHVVDPDPNIRPEQDPIVLNAFVSLSRRIGEPVGRTDNRPAVKDVGGLYFLWAMERIAVLYDIQTLGKKDWYKWGAEILICHQKQDGSWSDDGGYPSHNPVINTCFALMFLRRANLTPDLSRRLTVDTSTLTAKVDDTITPKKPAPSPPSPKVEAAPTTTEPPPPEEPKEPGATPKPVPAPEPVAETPAPAKKSNNLVRIILGALFAALIGGFIAFLIAKRMKEKAEEEEEKPRKKKAKAKKKVKVEVDDD